MILYFIRAVFLLIFAGAGWQAGVFLNGEELLNFWKQAGTGAPSAYWCLLGGLGLYLIMLGLELGFGRISIHLVSSIVFGCVVGLIIAFMTWTAVLLHARQLEEVKPVLQLAFSCVFCYLGVAIIYKTRDRFRFIVPYVEFRREERGPSPMLLDTSSIIDGRVAELTETRFLDAPLIIPRFVLDELQAIADASDRSRRMRGRRGLDILNRLQHSPHLALEIREDVEDAEKPVDRRLISLAKRLQARIVTNDSPLAKIARLEGVDVINLNEIAIALQPVVIPGEETEIDLVRAGEEPGQGIGYLQDGTMVVVENGHPCIGSSARVVISSVLQRDSGRLVFAKLKANSKNKNDAS